MENRPEGFFAVVVGAGPAGLTAAYKLAKAGKSVLVLERDPKYVGGISRTVDFHGFLFDIGGHRFFTKSKEVAALWDELLPGELLEKLRASRIYYRKKFFAYPLRPTEVFRKLGLTETMFCLASYLKSKVFPHPNPATLEGWLTNSFGRRLFLTFFKTYTEKVWGRPCAEISSDWAVQRIKGLSLRSLIWNGIFRRPGIRSLTESFRYPPRGPGMMWEACSTKIRELGGKISMGCRVDEYLFDPVSQEWAIGFSDASGKKHVATGDHVICSAPLGDTACRISPPLTDEAIGAARGLRHRDFFMVAIVLRGPELFSDNWLYIHDPGVKLGRLQNFKAWSEAMVPERGSCSYGAEYFCDQGDPLWEKPDADLVEMALQELRWVGLLRNQELLFAKVIRQLSAYPLYDAHYDEKIATIRKNVGERVKNLHFVGRNGMHRYDNQDHAMMTALIAAENILAGREVRDPWKVNQDAEYLEESRYRSNEAGMGIVAQSGS